MVFLNLESPDSFSHYRHRFSRFADLAKRQGQHDQNPKWNGITSERAPVTDPDRRIQTLAFDVIVIGGGITGAWTALECSLRGWSTLLLEKDDFGGATSMRSSRLLHGGIRYLQQLQFQKVRESAEERNFLIESAPHMVAQVPFIVPTYSGFRRGGLFLRAGMLAYRLLTRQIDKALADPSNRLPPDRKISRLEILDQGGIDSNGLTGGRVLYEAQLQSSERMTFSVIDLARQHGAVAMNYISAESYVYEAEKVVGVVAKDRETQKTKELRARLVINAAGPWCDQLNAKGSLHQLNTGFARGAHIVTRKLLSHYAVALPSAFRGDGVATRGNRHIFIIPWRDRSLIGTSYMEADSPSADLIPEGSEISQLIDTVNAAMPSAQLNHDDLLHAFAGYYPLQSDSIKSGIYQGTGEYRLVDHERIDGLGGLITALGAKFTTGRRLAEMAADIAQQKLGAPDKGRRTSTRGIKLAGGAVKNIRVFREQAVKAYAPLWSEKTCLHLVDCYGTQIDDLATLCREEADLAQTLSPNHDTVRAQIIWAAKYESVVHLSDIVFRRTDLCLLGDPGNFVLQECARLAGEVLGWTPDRQAEEVALVRAELDSSTSGFSAEGILQ